MVDSQGRARVLYCVMGESRPSCAAASGMTGVQWLTSPELAAGVPHRVRPR